MNTVAGIFKTRSDAERAIENLRGIGLPDENLNLLAPGMSDNQVEASVPTSDTEQPGMGNALGGLVGGAMGAAGGMTLGAAAAYLALFIYLLSRALSGQPLFGV